MTIKIVVNNYMKCGHKHGFFTAEFILAKFLPAEFLLNGKCYQVPEHRREAFVKALKNGKL